MKGHIEKTVFISYRRTNLPWALAIYQHLDSLGYDVFFDYSSIKSGDFEQIITQNVKGRAHFLVLLTPSALKRCNEPRDWLRREIELAIDEKRNIVPLFLEGFSFSSPSVSKYLTGKLELLKKYNGMTVPAEYFEAAMTRLREDYLNIPLSAVLHPISETVERVVKIQKAAASRATKVQKKELSAQEWFEKGLKLNDNSDEEIMCYTEAIRLNPEYAEAYYNRGLARSDKGDLEGAIKDYNQAILLNPNDAEAYYNRGVTGYERGDLEGALKDYNQAIRLNPNDAEAYYNRGLARSDKGDLDGALKDYNQAIRLKPKYADAYYGRGTTLQAKGKIEKALADYEESIRINPKHSSAVISSIGVLRKLGNTEKAKQREQAARKLIRNTDEYNQACFEAICGNTDKALELLKIGLEKKRVSKVWAKQDPDLENIRDDPRFKKLVGERNRTPGF